MVSSAEPVIPATSVHGSTTTTTTPVREIGGKGLPAGGNQAPPSQAPPSQAPPSQAPPSNSRGAGSGNVEAQVALLNRALNDSGRPNQFRVDPTSGSTLIQEINPANGDVIAEYPSISFPALARSLGISGALIDALA